MPDIWTYHARDQSPAAVALVFAQTAFDPPREPEAVSGGWTEAEVYIGRFRLVDGVREYEIRSERGGGWLVRVVD